MCKEQGKGKSKDQAPFDPGRWHHWIIDNFLEYMSTNNYHVEAWSRNAGVYMDWEREQKLYQDVQRRREVAKGDGRDGDLARSSGYHDTWTGKRPRR
eukprot:8428808-Pyramimonas_sp.AAC.1